MVYEEEPRFRPKVGQRVIIYPFNGEAFETTVVKVKNSRINPYTFDHKFKYFQYDGLYEAEEFYPESVAKRLFHGYVFTKTTGKDKEIMECDIKFII